jgi:hypothetical protein
MLSNPDAVVFSLAKEYWMDFVQDLVLNSVSYDYSDLTTVAQEYIPNIRNKRKSNMNPIVDVVFISNASKNS